MVGQNYIKIGLRYCMYLLQVNKGLCLFSLVKINMTMKNTIIMNIGKHKKRREEPHQEMTGGKQTTKILF